MQMVLETKENEVIAQATLIGFLCWAKDINQTLAKSHREGLKQMEGIGIHFMSTDILLS